MSRVTRTLTALDFSPGSLAALDFALVLASKEPDASMHVAHAVALPIVPLASGDAVLAADFDRRLREENQKALSDAIGGRAGGPAKIETHLIEGPAPLAIVEQAKVLGATRIAVGATGRGPIPRFLLGSVTDRVVRTAPVDVLVVPTPTKDAPARTQIRNVVCAIDFSPPAENALLRAFAIAKAHGARLHLVHAWHVAPYVERMPELVTSIERDMAYELDAQAHRHETPGQSILRHLRRGPPSQEILALATLVDADLVVVGTTGKTGLDHFLLGSVAERVVRASHVPVLVVRAPVTE